MPKYAIVMTIWETNEDTTELFCDTYEEAVSYLENTLQLTKADGYWFNSAEKYTIEEME